MSTLQEIKAAVAQLGPSERALLAAEIFADQPVCSSAELESALTLGLADVEGGRVRPLEDARKMVSGGVAKS